MAVRQDGISGHASDEYLAVLGDEHRRAVVGVLAEIGGVVDLTFLATRVAAEVEGVTRDELSVQDVERAKIELHHHHLPKLDELGVLEYAYEENRVVPTSELKTVQNAVEMTDAVRHTAL